MYTCIYSNILNIYIYIYIYIDLFNLLNELNRLDKFEINLFNG